MQIIFAELASGNGQPFVDAMHDDFAWTISGQGPSARTWRGRDAVRPELFRQLSTQFATKKADRHDNDYCYVWRFGDDGKLIALTEYMDTALAECVLAPPR